MQAAQPSYTMTWRWHSKLEGPCRELAGAGAKSPTALVPEHCPKRVRRVEILGSAALVAYAATFTQALFCAGSCTAVVRM
jgi:hypothetical protein